MPSTVGKESLNLTFPIGEKKIIEDRNISNFLESSEELKIGAGENKRNEIQSFRSKRRAATGTEMGKKGWSPSE